MANIDDIVRSAQGGRLTDNLAQHFGLASWQTEAAVAALVPALSAGFRKAAEEPASLAPLIEAVRDPRHAAAFGSSEQAYSEDAVERGAKIVDRLFGSPATGQIAQLAARESSVRADILQQLLPVLATIVVGGLFERALDDEGRAAILGELAAEAPAVAPAAPPERPAGLVARLAAFVTALLGGKQAGEPAAAPAAPQAAAPDPLQGALDQIREALTPGAAVSADHQASLDDLLAKVFGSWKS